MRLCHTDADRRLVFSAAVLINGALIASLFLVIAVGDRLGGAWVLLFPAWLLVLFAAAMWWLRRHPRPVPTNMQARRLVLLLTAVVTGLVVGGPSYALIAGISCGLALLLVSESSGFAAARPANPLPIPSLGASRDGAARALRSDGLARA